ncbi:hypothetical protein CO2235_MP70229 [Cupriavidus oxalaticus]|uniref:Uncharacterized protein n=1 Tax=Cupriavidus oxalaticus TaxID=96344 RepID=A0A375GLB2_9BURK|nr:hypothetical protein CO2235_U880012 [Cupriavidus oxalaticus]SPC23558.1 hypothetical protein CO2235_MP70229 [Cupriavidus oxalaticus]
MPPPLELLLSIASVAQVSLLSLFLGHPEPSDG